MLTCIACYDIMQSIITLLTKNKNIMKLAFLFLLLASLIFYLIGVFSNEEKLKSYFTLVAMLFSAIANTIAALIIFNLI